MTPDSPSPAEACPDMRDRALSRRALLVGGAGLAALGVAGCATSEGAERGETTGRGPDELPSETTPQDVPADPPIITGEFVSQKMAGRPTRWAVARPRGVSGELPVVLVAHALNTNEKSIFAKSMNLQGALQRYVDAGNAPFALAAADVDRNYFHRRADGTDGAAMFIDEFMPMLDQNPALNLRTDRVGLYGWSMGGYGALRMGSILGPQRVAAIAVSSPAMWADPTMFPPRAFDSYADYEANSMFGQQHVFSRIPLMISIGTSDQFYTYTRQWAADLHPPAAFATTPGGHTTRFWRSVMDDQIRFLGRELER